MPNLSKRVAILLFFLSSVIIHGNANPDLIYSICQENSSYTSNSTFHYNLDLLLTSLSSNSTSLSGQKFHNTTAGQAPDMVYGLYLCRGDVTAAACQNCKETASQEIMTKCPNKKEAVSWYDQCMLRYSNRSIFSIMEERPAVTGSNSEDIEDPERFHQIVNETMVGLINKAAYNSSDGDMFETGEANFKGSTKIYGLVQCTPDLSGNDCSKCLENIFSRIPNCCYGKQGARILAPSCNFRYEIYPFYGNITSATPPAPSPLSPPGKKGNSSPSLIAIIVPVVGISIISGFLIYCWLNRKTRKIRNGGRKRDSKLIVVGEDSQSMDSLVFDLDTLRAATNGFSDANKIGEGGFGAVYKGVLSNGQEIGVKRLSRNSEQGAEEFKNEISLVAKLQHRNLVQLLGFCLEEREKILIYEFVPNKSLDYILFDPDKQSQLDWPRRYKIIVGIARGLLYLHEESRLKIIHRDLKASNILLDFKLNPKISDFGMARIFVMDQSQANTRRIVGTYGYMSPEYAMHGQFSVKSDVFSFGVLLLEIISGKKNSCFYNSDCREDLLSYAWRHWKDRTPMELIDPVLGGQYSRSEVMRCIHIALLCVQEDAANRPTMASIVLMLNRYSVTLPLPLKPAFFLHTKTEFDPSKSVSDSVDERSITEVYPR